MRSSTGTAPPAAATRAGVRSATVQVRRRELGDPSRARSSRVVITADISRADAEICSRSCRVSGSATPRSSARSAEPWIEVSGVRSSCASSAVSRCSDRIAEATRSSRWSRVSPSAASSLVGGPRSNRCGQVALAPVRGPLGHLGDRLERLRGDPQRDQRRGRDDQHRQDARGEQRVQLRPLVRRGVLADDQHAAVAARGVERHGQQPRHLVRAVTGPRPVGVGQLVGDVAGVVADRTRDQPHRPRRRPRCRARASPAAR